MVRSEARFSARWTFVAFMVALSVLLIAAAGIAVTHQAMQARQKASEEQLAAERLAAYPLLTAEELDVYRAVLSIALGDATCNKLGECMHLSILYGEGGINLSQQIGAINHPGAEDCLKKLGIDTSPPSEVHRFRMEDVAQLGDIKLRLVDPGQRLKWIIENNPDDARREGRPAKAVVEDGFEHGLTTLSEIRFDKSHAYAIVSVSYVCGRLCGDGTTMLMEKKNGAWIQKSDCGGWVS